MTAAGILSRSVLLTCLAASAQAAAAPADRRAPAESGAPTLQEHRTLSGAAKRAAEHGWAHYPVAKPQFPNVNVRWGIVTGNASSSSGRDAMAIMQRYARRHGYGFYRSESLATPTEKIELLQKTMGDTAFLVWIDPEVVITKPEMPIETVLREAFPTCNNLQQPIWENDQAKEAVHDTFLWVGAGSRPGEKMVNADMSFMVLRDSAGARTFLKEALKHAKGKSADEAMFTALVQEPAKFFAKSCFGPPSQLVNDRHTMWSPAMFAQSVGSMPKFARERAASAILNRMVK